MDEYKPCRLCIQGYYVIKHYRKYNYFFVRDRAIILVTNIREWHQCCANWLHPTQNLLYKAEKPSVCLSVCILSSSGC